MYTNQTLIELVNVLRKENSTETEWLEFKENYASPQDIGEYISALSNAAALWGRPYAYLIFGIKDETHEVVGTTYDYRKQKQGNEDLENWLNRLVEPRIGFNFYEINYSALKKLVLIEIPAADKQPTAFAGKEYIRVGSYRQDLRRYPETERRLWNELNHVLWEEMVSPVQNLHFKFLALVAESRGVEFSEDKFTTLRMIDSNGKFNNLAYLLSDENRHMVKFAVYRNKMYDFAVKKEFEGSWVAVLEQVLEYINIYNETSARVIGSDATRTEVKSYPDPSLREAVVNAFCHFDASFPSDIKIEFFPDKVVVGSPGALYHTTMQEVLGGRQSFRNPNLVYVLSKFNFIENYATGLKKIISAYDKYPAKPTIETTDNFFVVTLPNVKVGTQDENYFDKTNDTQSAINDTKNDTVNDTLNDTVKGILTQIEHNTEITIVELMKAVGKSRPTVTRAIAELKEKGYIVRIGSDKTGSWKVLK